MCKKVSKCIESSKVIAMKGMCSFLALSV